MAEFGYLRLPLRFNRPNTLPRLLGMLAESVLVCVVCLLVVPAQQASAMSPALLLDPPAHRVLTPQLMPHLSDLVTSHSPPKQTPGVTYTDCESIFESSFVRELEIAYSQARFTAAVHDHRNGCKYHLNPNLELTTASVIKAQVLAGVLLMAQDDDRPLSQSEVSDIELMMHYSHNTPPTSRLYVAIGAAEGMEALDDRFQIAGTSHTSRYGATLSTAWDRTVLAEQLLIGGGPLDESSVLSAWEWMSSVSVIQSWGISAGLPAGYEAALKNGFYPSRGVGWRLGSTGAVRDPSGGYYAVTIMTDNNPDESSGIALVEAIATQINANLARGEPAPRLSESITCVTPSTSSSWDSLAESLGGIDGASLRHLNGGEPAPLLGQRVCKP